MLEAAHQQREETARGIYAVECRRVGCECRAHGDVRVVARQAQQLAWSQTLPSPMQAFWRGYR